MKLKNRDSLELLAGLRSLDACKFGDSSGAMSYRIVRNLRALLSISEDIEAARKKLVLEFSKGTGVIPANTEEAQRFGAQWESVLATEVEVRLFTFRWADLKVGENNIPGTVLAALDPVVTGQPEEFLQLAHG